MRKDVSVSYVPDRFSDLDSTSLESVCLAYAARDEQKL